jgi:catechol 2,3-dioxygenase-like lactoylglutathione lyase family enzyme
MEIGQIAITVCDITKALGFYRDILGLNFLFQPSLNLAFLEAGSVRIMLSTPQGAGRVGPTQFSISRSMIWSQPIQQ